jgi:hypothetical protein
MTSILFDEYYKLKDAYEKNIKTQRFDILKQKNEKNVTSQDIRKKLMRLKPKCVNCQNEGGTIFSSAFDEKELSRVLSAKCGVVSNPCSLNIRIIAGSHEGVQDILKHDEQELKHIKQRIIDEKNKLLFGYMKSEEVIENFDQLKKQINEYSSSIEYYTKIYYDKVDNKADQEGLNKLTADSYTSIQTIKDFLRHCKYKPPTSEGVLSDNDKSYEAVCKGVNGEEYEEQNVVSAVKVYVEQLKPKLDKIMRLKYKQNIVWYDDDDMTYHLIQTPQTIDSLEVALVETRVMSQEKRQQQPQPETVVVENEESFEEADEDSDEGSGISIGDEIQDDSYESLD